MSVSTLVISIAIYGLSLNLFVDNNLLCIQTLYTIGYAHTLYIFIVNIQHK